MIKLHYIKITPVAVRTDGVTLAEEEMVQGCRQNSASVLTETGSGVAGGGRSEMLLRTWPQLPGH